jgi:hypothetical protein
MTRTIPLAILAALVLSVPAGAEDKPVAPGERMYLGLEPLESCVKRWDSGTNMSKEEWRASCKRISDERGTYIREHGLGQPE